MPDDKKDEKRVERSDATRRLDRLAANVDRTKRELNRAGERAESSERKSQIASRRDRLARSAEMKNIDGAIGEFKEIARALQASGDASAAQVLKRLGRLERMHGREVNGFLKRSDLVSGERNSLFNQVVGHDAFKMFQQKKIRDTGNIEVGGFHGRKATPLATDAATRFSEPQRVGMIEPVLRSLRVRDLMPSATTTAGVIEYLQETGFTPATKASMTSISSSGTVATATTAAAHGLYPGDRVSIRGAVETKYNGEAIIVLTTPSTTTFTYTVASAGATSATGTITWTSSEKSAGAGFVSEGSSKPESELTFTLVQCTAQIIATHLTVTRQVIDDIGMLESYITNRLLYALKYAEDAALLYGTGTAPQIQGILTHPGIQNYSWSSGVVGDEKGDAIRRAMTLSYVTDYEPTGVVLNPDDWDDIELTKDTQGMYVFVMMQQAQGLGSSIWRLPAVITNSIHAGTGLTGGFAQASQIFDRASASVRMYEQHSDYPIKNLILMLAEERLAAAWYRPEAFVKINFNAAP